MKTWKYGQILCLSGLVVLGGCGRSEPELTRPPLDLTVSAESAAGETAGEMADAGCERVEPGVIRVDEPTLQAAYSLEHLGVVTFRSDEKTIRTCLDAAVQDGAEILSRSAGEFTALYPTRFEAFLDAARERIDIDAVEGLWSDSQKRIIPGVAGRKVDMEATWSAFREAVGNGADSFPIVVRESPALSGDVSALSGFSPDVLIGSYRTVFSNKKNRTINVKLAASSLNGIFLMPGAEFSYNDWVGERSEARGFKEAPVIEQGQTVEGLGGGACQVSSTVHAAALMAGLGILERSNHSLPSSYIPVGMDAVVSYPILDLRVKNTLDRPVVLRVHTEENNLIAQFFSDQPRKGKVMFRREVSEEIPFKEVITVDPTLEPGTVKIKKRGKVGYKVLRGRITIANGTETYEKLLMDTYQPQTQQTVIAPDVVYPPEEEEDGG
ncbi:MAG: VanW family protein [Proteobacteria bacterium]|nr:VanW family protein [Pseudomonadota bacterium]